MSISSQEWLLKTLRMFSPNDGRLAFEGSYWRICQGVYTLREERFSLEALNKVVNENSASAKQSLSTKETSSVLERLRHNGFLSEEADGSLRVLPDAANALNEFFGFGVNPRTGKIGLARYLFRSEKRVMMWYCLHEPERHQLNAEEAAGVTGYPSEKCGRYLERFAGKKWLRKERGSYLLIDRKPDLLNREAILAELLLGYYSYCFATPALRNLVALAILHHEKVSGKMIRDDLEEEDVKCDPKTVYNHVKAFVKDGILTPTGESRKVRGAREEFYAVNLEKEVAEEHVRNLMAYIKKRLERSGLDVGPEFFNLPETKRPASLQNFWEGLRWGFVLRSPDQTSTLPLWLKLLEELYPKVLSPMFSEISNVIPENPHEKLKTISDRYKMSPLITSIMYYSLCKFPKRVNLLQNSSTHCK